MTEDSVVMECADFSEIDGKSIIECAKSEEGDVIHLWMADKTPEDHGYVPWPLINGKLHRGGDLIHAICEAYNGTKPEVCSMDYPYFRHPSRNCIKPNNYLKSDAKKVNVTLYYESLCPGCAEEITNEINTIVNGKTGLENITEITLVPFGNADIISRDPIKIECQHGDEECYGNQVEGCAISKYTYEKHMQFIICIEDIASMQDDPFSDENVAQCAKEAEIDSEELLKCAKGDEGLLIHLQMGDKTPNHYYVPWNEINGKTYLGDSIIEGICEIYEGEKPKICDEWNYNKREFGKHRRGCKNTEFKRIHRHDKFARDMKFHKMNKFDEAIKFNNEEPRINVGIKAVDPPRFVSNNNEEPKNMKMRHRRSFQNDDEPREFRMKERVHHSEEDHPKGHHEQKELHGFKNLKGRLHH